MGHKGNTKNWATEKVYRRQSENVTAEEKTFACKSELKFDPKRRTSPLLVLLYSGFCTTSCVGDGHRRVTAEEDNHQDLTRTAAKDYPV